MRKLAGRLAAPLACLAVAAACWLRTPAPRWAPPSAAFARGTPFGITSQEIEPGECLIHGIPSSAVGVSWRMPLSSAGLALVYNHVPLRLQQAALALFRAGPAVLAFQLAGLLGGGVPGGLAAAAAVLLTSANDGINETSLYVLLVLLVALVAAWRAAAPSRRRDLVLGLATGLSLLCRSPLFLYPVIVVAGEAARNRIGRALAIVGLPCAMLLPWIAMNAAVEHRFIPLEDRRAEANMAAAALGFVPTLGFAQDLDQLGVDIRSAEPSPSERGRLAWVVATIARHPARYLSGAARRAAFVVRLHPVLLFLAILGAWLCRGRAGTREVALLAAYFASVHCLMAVEARYFEPLWPLLAGLVGGAFSRLRRRAAAPGMALAWSYLAPLSALGAASLSLTAAYPLRLAAGRTINQALAEHPDDGWLWDVAGQNDLAAGNADIAASEFARAAELLPRLEILDHRRAVALAAAGFPEPDWLPWFESSDEFSFEGLLLASLSRLEHGRVPDARRAYAAALEKFRGPPASPAELETETERAAYRELVASRPDPLARQLDRFLRLYPDERRLELMRKCEGLAPRVELALDEAELARRLGRGDDALAALRRAERMGPDGGQARRISDEREALTADAGIASDAGLAERARRDLARAQPRDPRRWLELAEAASRAGDRTASATALERAEALRPDAELRERAAAAWSGIGQPRRAEAIYRSLSASEPGRAGPWLGLAEAASRGGDRKTALDALERASSSRPDERQERAIAILYTASGRPQRALEILDELLKAPGQARERAGLRGDRGLTYALLGRRADAIKDLREAIRLEPDRLSPYATLAELYSSAGRVGDAIACCESGLSRPRRPEDEGARRALEAALARLRVVASRSR